jgi:hypothetical protein
MRRFKMLVFSSPRDAREREFDEWYTGRHLDDICALPGFTAAQRFTLHSAPMGEAGHSDCAIYDMETDDPDAVVANMFSLTDSDMMPISPAFDMDSVQVMIFEEHSGLVRAPANKKDRL